MSNLPPLPFSPLASFPPVALDYIPCCTLYVVFFMLYPVLSTRSHPRLCRPTPFPAFFFYPNSKDARHRSLSFPLCNRLYIRYLLLFVLFWPLLFLLNGLVFCLSVDGQRLPSLQFLVVWAKTCYLGCCGCLSPFRWPGFDAQGHIHFRVKN